MTQKNFPVKDQTFEDIITQNLIYADKTEYIYNLITNQPKNTLFTRPRRFGKTLLLDTIQTLFTGSESLFSDLWIYKKSRYKFPKCRVISLKFSVGSETPKLFEKNIFAQLKTIAVDSKLKIKPSGHTADIFLWDLIVNITSYSRDKVVILIDDFDAPVTQNLHNFVVAKQNAEIINDIFTTLKEPTLAKLIHLTFITGVTRYGLASTGQWGESLNDITVHSDFSGMCGFTPDEFDSLFSNHLKKTLQNFKDTEVIDASTTESDLRNEIYHWYGDYSWTGSEKILNPYSVFKFFENNLFFPYWSKSSNLGNITPLLKSKPMDFLVPPKKSYPSKELRNTELTGIQAVPFLFYNGYLTLDEDRKSGIQKSLRSTKKASGVEGLSKRNNFFKPPNFDISSCFIGDCLVALFGLTSAKSLLSRGEKLKEAFLHFDAASANSIFNSFFSKFVLYERPQDGTSFYNFLRIIFSSLGFDVRKDISTERPEIYLALDDKVCVIVEFRYFLHQTTLSKDEENQILAKEALEKLPPALIEQHLSEAVKAKLRPAALLKLHSNLSLFDNNERGKRKIQAEAAETVLTPAELDKTLATAAWQRFSADDIKEILLKAAPKFEFPEEKIRELLDQNIVEAFDVITETDYQAILQNDSLQIINVVFAIFEDGKTFKVAFEP
ncbi:MAG: AAA family ATPase [Deltaproteobacteria bacterium]|jgi:hypothetical protein|nr:AAA family ATPase [Deltaproteobacteria bacterium]